MRSWKNMSGGLKVALVATVILALSIVGVLAKEGLDGGNQDDVQARDPGAGTEKPDDEVKATGKALELGTVAKISSNYRVAVTEVTRYEVPTGQLIAATVEATYIGKQDGEPWADFNVEFFGSGSRSFGESDCPFDLGDLDPSDQPILETGDDATSVFCLDMPVKTIKDGKILVEEAFSTDDRTFWSTDGAVTKELPPPPRQPSGTRSPATQPQGQPAQPRGQADNNDDWDIDKYCEDYEDNVNAYKDGIDDWDKLYEQADEDDQDEYEAWKDKMEAIIDQYEKNCG